MVKSAVKIRPVILAGGQGSRFWPVSREKNPKQFLSIKEGQSLIQSTFNRLDKLVPKDSDITIVTNELHKDLVKKHLPNCKILVEPQAKNTAAAIGLAALFLNQKDPDSVMLVLPADHYISDIKVLKNYWYEAALVANNSDSIVTLGIKPTEPNTGYGYIKVGNKIKGLYKNKIFTIDKFVEKPNLEKALKYLEAKNYYWNSGMFLWKPKVILEEIKKYMPDLYEQLEYIRPHLNTKRENFAINKAFSKMPSQSIDIGVIEKSKICNVILTQDLGWSDVGTWDVWMNYMPKDKMNNVIQGNVFAHNCLGSLIKSSDKFIAGIGLEHLIVIETKDSILICPKRKAQEVKKVVEYLKETNKKELI